MVKNRKVKKNWSDQDLKILIWIVAKYCEKKRIKDVYTGIVKNIIILGIRRLEIYFLGDTRNNIRNVHV